MQLDWDDASSDRGEAAAALPAHEGVDSGATREAPRPFGPRVGRLAALEASAVERAPVDEEAASQRTSSTVDDSLFPVLSRMEAPVESRSLLPSSSAAPSFGPHGPGQGAAGPNDSLLSPVAGPSAGHAPCFLAAPAVEFSSISTNVPVSTAPRSPAAPLPARSSGQVIHSTSAATSAAVREQLVSVSTLTSAMQDLQSRHQKNELRFLRETLTAVQRSEAEAQAARARAEQQAQEEVARLRAECEQEKHALRKEMDQLQEEVESKAKVRRRSSRVRSGSHPPAAAPTSRRRRRTRWKPCTRSRRSLLLHCRRQSSPRTPPRGSLCVPHDCGSSADRI